jgi:hypothetical protein
MRSEVIALGVMEFSFLTHFSSIGLAICLFVIMLASYWVGSTVWLRFRGFIAEGFGPVEGSLLGLLALILAFTFSMAAARYDARRAILVQEANHIGTAILRADLYDAPERAAFRADFKEYVEVRIGFHYAGFDEEKVKANIKQSSDISSRIWQRAARLGHDPRNLISSNQMVPALNNMIDVVTTRNALRYATVPDSIIWVLFILCAVSSFIIGISRKESGGSFAAVNVIFALMITSCVYLIVDLDRPLAGLISNESVNHNLVDLRGLFDTP